MKFEMNIEKNIVGYQSGKRTIYLEITDHDLMNISLDDHDQKLIHECEKSEKVSDKLLALELMVRNIEGVPA